MTSGSTPEIAEAINQLDKKIIHTVTHKAYQGIEYVLHKAALGNFPRSIEDPITNNAANISGFLNMIVAAQDIKVRSFTHAASSTYGDHPELLKVENIIGKPLSPFAVTKYVNELCANILHEFIAFKELV